MNKFLQWLINPPPDGPKSTLLDENLVVSGNVAFAAAASASAGGILGGVARNPVRLRAECHGLFLLINGPASGRWIQCCSVSGESVGFRK